MQIKPVEFVASSREDLAGFPLEVRRALGLALFKLQCGEMPSNAKPMRGFLRDAVELVQPSIGGTYRLVCTIKIGTVVYVLHAFQKKSRRGIATPKSELQLVAARLHAARQRNASL
jgi:phage-related protein